MKITRREFGKQVLLSTVGLGVSASGPATSGPLLLPGPPPGESKKSLVASLRSEKLRRVKHRVDRAAASEFLDRAMVKITGVSTPKAAWKSLFAAHESVGLKLSCLPGKPLSSSEGVVMAIVEGLRSAGVKDHNIYIWERTGRELENAGFKLSRKGLNIVGTDHFSNSGYSPDIEISGSVGTCFSQLVGAVDAMISVPVLKDHDIAGVSIGMKNFYGAIHNPNKFHGNNCDPYVADLCNHPFIKNKWRLTVCDATRIQVHNGPAFFPRYAAEYGGLLVGTDPVAVDAVGWRIIEEERKAMKLKPLKAENREPHYIASAARLNLGQADINLIRKIDI